MKRLCTVLTLSLLLLGVAQYAVAEPELRLSSLNVFRGGISSLHLSLSGGLEPYAGVNAKIVLPDGITVMGVSKGAQLPEGFTIDWRSFSGQGINGARVIVYSGVNSFTESTGALLEISIQIAPDAPLGMQTIQLQNSGLSNEDGSSSISHVILNGVITCFIPDQDSDDDGLSNATEISLGTNPLITDTDGDVLPDNWEVSFNLNPLVKDASTDTDGDGFSNLEEYHAGTNPQNALSFPLSVEICDGKDNDGDAQIDEEGALGCMVHYLDIDGDGYGVDEESRCLCLPEGYYTASLPGDMDDTDPEIGANIIAFDMVLGSGWSMISLPVIPMDSTVGALFPDAKAIFTFSSKYDLLRTNDSLEVGRGCWINLSEPHTYTITGIPINNYSLHNVQKGWSMIGACSYPAKIMGNGCAIGAIFGFTNKYSRIKLTDDLQAGKGYWIYLRETMERGKLLMNASDNN